MHIAHKKSYAVIAVVIAMLAGVFMLAGPAAPARADTTSDYKKQIFDNTNAARTTAGKQYVHGSDHLNKIAQDWADYMASTSDYKHNPNVTAQTRAKPGWTWAGGENIAAGQKDGNAVYAAWFRSPGHQANILFDNYNRIGIGVAFGGHYGVYYVQVYGYNTGADPISYIYGDAPPVVEPPVEEPPVTTPPVTEPPVTEPPATTPPVTEPPVEEPPVTTPPVTEPPVTEPPATTPPVTEPPVTEPPVTTPPVTEPPVTTPPVKPVDPPVKPPVKPPVVTPPVSTGTLINKGDIVARDSAGKLWNYGNLYKAGSSKKLISTGWNSMRDIVVTDFNADGVRDIIANSKNDGKLYLYVGKKTGGFNAKKAIGTSGWSNLELHIAKMKKTDKYPSIITRTPTGDLNLYQTKNGSTITKTGKIGSGWKSFRSISVAYFDNNGNIDVLAETTAGKLLLYRTNGKTFISETRKTVGSGWTGLTFTSQMNVHGTNSSGYAALNKKTGQLIYYPMSGKVGFGTKKTIGFSGWSTFYVAKQTL